VRKNKLYIVLVILTITFLFATAAVCTQCGVLGDEGEEAGDTDDNGKSADADDSGKPEEADDSGKEEESKDTNEDKNDDDKKDEPKSDDKKSDDENKPPVIAGIYLDDLDPAVYDFSANGVYTVRADATDPEGGNLTFKWSGDGTIVGEDINPMTWTAPDSEGVYKITVEVTDEEGSTADRTADVYVNSALGEPPKGQVILDIEIQGSDDSKYYKDDVYIIQVNVNDPDNEIVWYQYDIDVICLAKRVATDWYSFRTPDTAGDIDIVIEVDVLDKDDNIIDEKTKTIHIEP